MTEDEYLSYDALGLADLVRTGEVRPSELLDIALERTSRLNPALNAVVHLMEPQARSSLEDLPKGSPFAGVPFLLKDLVCLYDGVPTSQGSSFTQTLVPDHDSEMVRRYRRSGLVIFGKTNTPEFGLVPYTEPRLFGPCRNPWNLSRTPGGSSGGSAAAVAAGLVPIAGGGDGGGSIRIPASCCGLFGLKPTRGRTPTGPDAGELWRGAAIEHVLTRSVRDSAAMLDALRGPEPGAPYLAPPPKRPFLAETGRDPRALKIAYTGVPFLGSGVHADCIAALQDAAALLESLGHEVVEDEPLVEGAAFARAFLVMVCAELGADLDDMAALLGRRARRADLEPASWALSLLAGTLTARDYAGALRVMERAARSVGSFFQRYDALLTPTLALPPPALGDLRPSRTEHALLRFLGSIGSGRLLRSLGTLDRAAATAFEFTPWTPVFNATGQPAASLPLFWNDQGLPVGVQLVTRFADEAGLFRLARQLERARPWFHRRPPVESPSHA